MVRELERKRQSAEFPETAPAANPVFFRTYTRRTKAWLRETWDELCHFYGVCALHSALRRNRHLQNWSAFRLMIGLALMGCGTGAVMEPQYINQLPPIRIKVNAHLVVATYQLGTQTFLLNQLHSI
ncbi:hypothetical protein IQ243_24945 [Nostocales cyanobacterium LEGE 11386]|nr:hypothetical protein [Nostocales cyanobacterium LEGE 11386]